MSREIHLVEKLKSWINRGESDDEIKQNIKNILDTLPDSSSKKEKINNIHDIDVPVLRENVLHIAAGNALPNTLLYLLSMGGDSSIKTGAPGVAQHTPLELIEIKKSSEERWSLERKASVNILRTYDILKEEADRRNPSGEDLINYPQTESESKKIGGKRYRKRKRKKSKRKTKNKSKRRRRRKTRRRKRRRKKL